MKKIIISIVILVSVIFVFTGCMAFSHAGHRGSDTSQHSAGCH